VRARSRWVRDAVELVSSMRFSISLLTVICIASMIGTVVKQHEPYGNYVNQFGPFWADAFDRVGLFAATASGGSCWSGVLVVSTSLCIARNAPKIIVDLRTFKEQIREQSLGSSITAGQAERAEAPAQNFERIAALLASAAGRPRASARHGTMIAARRRRGHKLGYIAAHSAIVLVCWAAARRRPDRAAADGAAGQSSYTAAA